MTQELARDAYSYTAEVDHPKDGTLCKCSGCGHVWGYFQLRPIGGCSLTPGDASPAGRCGDPSCDSVAYPAEPRDLIRDNAEAFAKIAAEMIFGAGDDASLQRMIDASRKALDDCGLLVTREAARAAGILPPIES